MQTINEQDRAPPSGGDVTLAVRSKTGIQTTGPRPTYGLALAAYGVNIDSSLVPFTNNKDLLARTKVDNFYSPKNDHFYSNIPYLDLEEDYGEIRLLKVSASTGNANLCSFELVDKVPIASVQGRYTTLSYCAGSPEKTKAVFVNGLSFNAFANLEHALEASLRFWQREMGQREMLLWADQICINQSNLAERASQVLMMPEIYRRSEQVLVCLSSSSNTISNPAGTEKKKALADRLKGSSQTGYNFWPSIPYQYQTDSNREDARTLPNWTKDPSESFQNPFAWMRHCCERASIAIAQSRVSVLNPKQLNEGHNSLNTFLQQQKSFPAVLSWVSYIELVCSCPWWERAWVLQEFINAPKAVFLYEDESLPWPTLFIFISYFAERAVTFFGSWEAEFKEIKKRVVEQLARLQKQEGDEQEASARIERERNEARRKEEQEKREAESKREADLRGERQRWQMEEQRKHQELMSLLSQDHREKLQIYHARVAQGGFKSIFLVHPESPQMIVNRYHSELNRWSRPNSHSNSSRPKPRHVKMMEEKYRKLLPSEEPYHLKNHHYDCGRQRTKSPYSSSYHNQGQPSYSRQLGAGPKWADETAQQIEAQITDLHTIRNASLDLLTSKAWFMISMKANWRGRTDLMTLLSYARSSKALDPRDRIYAFLGLSHKGYEIIPSYGPENTVLHTFVDVAQAIVKHHDDLSILSYVNTGRDLLGCYLPSWVPDWNAVQLQEAVEFQKLFSTWQDKCGREFQASRGEKARASFQAHKTIVTRNEIRVKGIEVDSLAWVKKEFDSSWLQFESSKGHTIDTPITAVADDQVWILFGANCPIILREGFNGKYNFIGEALVWEGLQVSEIMFGRSMDGNLESARDIGIL